jgi:hypothetical protein
MKTTRTICVLLLCCLLGQHAAAGGNSTGEDQLRTILAKLSTADGYSYDTRIRTLMPGTQQADSAKMTNYQSRSQRVIYARSDKDFFFLCPQGQFRVSERDRQVYYKHFDDSDRAGLDRQWSSVSSNRLLDSLFLEHVLSLQKKSERGVLKFRLRYAAGASLQSAVISYSEAAAFVSRIQYKLEQSRAIPGGNAARVQQEVVMDNYRQKPPDDLSHLLSGMNDLEHFLQQTYKGYTLQSF